MAINFLVEKIPSVPLRICENSKHESYRSRKIMRFRHKFYVIRSPDAFSMNFQSFQASVRTTGFLFEHLPSVLMRFDKNSKHESCRKLNSDQFRHKIHIKRSSDEFYRIFQSSDACMDFMKPTFRMVQNRTNCHCMVTVPVCLN